MTVNNPAGGGAGGAAGSSGNSSGCCSSSSSNKNNACCGGDGGGAESAAEATKDHHKDNNHAPSSCCGDGNVAGKKSSCCSNDDITNVCSSNNESKNDNNDDNNDNSDKALCLAVVRENGTDVVVFDASGIPRAFQFKGDIRTTGSEKGGGGGGGKLCFSTHGATDDAWIGDALTPCFDEDGNHGTPDESCFCGVDTPHLHAHIHDPKTCGNGDDNEDTRTKKSSHAAADDDVGYLASQILHPIQDCNMTVTETESDDDHRHGDEDVLHIGVSERMPKECNSQQQQQPHEKQQQQQQRRKSSSFGRRMHRVKHDDHYDFLVHNDKTGELRLEHPDCQHCGQDDVHGMFRNVGHRKLLDRKGSAASSSQNMEVHFFEVAPRPFNILEHLHNIFEPNCSRVNVVEHFMEDAATGGGAQAPPPPPATTGTSNKVRSTFYCEDMTSSPSEVDIKLLEKIPGIHSVTINVSLKRILVYHNPQYITADAIASLITRNTDLKTTVGSDGGLSATAAGDAEAGAKETEMIGRTTLHVQGICCASEVPSK